MTISLEKNIVAIAKKARNAANELTDAKSRDIDKALRIMAELLTLERTHILKENAKDIAAAKKAGLTTAMIDRLTLSEKTFHSMIQGLKEVAALKNPVGTIIDKRTRPNGLAISRVRVPIGVIGIIYESRPNVTVDAAAICLKSQNAVILRGGSEACYSNRALASLFSKALSKANLPADAIQSLPTTDRAAVSILLTQDRYIDLIIPRGGESLIKAVVSQSTIPVIKHYKGICHIFISRNADIAKALPILINAKVQRPGVCNAMETLLLDKGLSSVQLKKIIAALQAAGVILIGDKETMTLAKNIKKATMADWETEYLDLRLSVRMVNNAQEAIEHINQYSSHHTDAIITKSKSEADMFIRRVDSASVMVNASTRFADGGEYGMGCEIGISTDKLHSRGPMGVEDLTTYKWIVEGTGQIRT
jgi:glutamate-5-semialdehyde dehydrogenase